MFPQRVSSINEVLSAAQEKALKDEDFRNKFLANPKKNLELELGRPLSLETDVKVLFDSERLIHFVIRYPFGRCVQDRLNIESPIDFLKEDFSEISSGMSRFSISTSFGIRDQKIYEE